MPSNPFSRTMKYKFPSFGAKRKDSVYQFGLSQYSGTTFRRADIADDELLGASLFEPIAYRLTHVVAHDTVNCGFDIVDDNGFPHRYNSKVLQDVEENNLLSVIDYAYALERIYGRSWEIRLDSDKYEELESYKETANKVIYTAISNPSVPKSHSTWDQFGKLQPIKADLRFASSGVALSGLEIKPEDYIFIRTRPYNNTDQGIPVLTPCWGDLVSLHVMRASFTERARKYGGFPHITVIGANDYVLQQGQNKWGDFDELKEAWSNEETSIDMKGLSGVALNPEQFLLPYIEQISIASAIPVPILRGVESGQLKSGQIIMSSYYSVIANNQAGLKPVVEQNVKWVNDSAKNFNVKWRLEFAISDIDRLSMREIEITNTVALQPYITREAFAKYLKLPIEDLRDEEAFNSVGQFNPMGGGLVDDSENEFGKKETNPVSEDRGRKFGEKKEKKLRNAGKQKTGTKSYDKAGKT